MIGIIGAMDIEMDYIKSILSDVKITNVSGVDFVTGTAYGKEVVAAKCGIGKVYAALCAEAMILTYRPDVIVNTGVAGSLGKNLRVLDVVVADKTCQHDMDTSPLGDPKGLISGVNKIFFECNERVLDALLKAATESGVNAVTGTIATGDCFVADSKLKEDIRETFGAVACEMEGGSIGQVCYLNNIPCGILRAISDGEGGECDYEVFARQAADNAGHIIENFIKLW